jgi:large-conductance mechanosensitive channel
MGSGAFDCAPTASRQAPSRTQAILITGARRASVGSTEATSDQSTSVSSVRSAQRCGFVTLDSAILLVVWSQIPGQRPYTHWQFTVRGSTAHVGLLLGDIAYFLLISAILFLFLVKFLGWLIRPKKLDEAAPALSRQEELLTEIRDLLKVPREPST